MPFPILALSFLLLAARVDSAADRNVVKSLRPVIELKGARVAAQTIAQRMKRHKVPGPSVAVVDGGRLVWARGFGEKIAGTGERVTPTTLFQAASISKPIVATLALRLVEDDALDLDKDVNRYLRSWKVPETGATTVEKVTIRRILSHTAGVTVPSFDGYRPGSRLPTLLEVLEGQRPPNVDPVRVDVVPGSTCRYSGGGYSILQLVLEDATSIRLPALARKLLFEPVKMADSVFDQPLPSDLRKRAAAAHLASGARIPGDHLSYPQLAAAGLWSTPTDLLKWASFIAGARAGTAGAILSQHMATEMLTIQKASVVGLGPFVKGSGRELQFGHQGWNRGFHSRVVFFPETGQGAAVMANGVGGRALVREILSAVAAAYQWPTLMPPEKVEAVSVGSEDLARVVGTYEGGHPIKVVVRIRQKGSGLLLDAPELGPETPVAFTAPAELITLDGGDRFSIRRAVTGDVTALGWGDMLLQRRR